MPDTNAALPPAPHRRCRAWILGLGLAVGAGILNSLWHEVHSPPDKDTTL
ncbi:cytochrome bd-I oxidase subunit CydX [Sphingopyxis fribergensis]